MNGTTLKSFLKAQRARRQKATPLIAPKKQRHFFLSRWTILVWTMLVVFVAGIIAVICLDYFFAKSLRANSVVIASPTNLALPTSTQQPNFVVRQVCTDIVDGRLHVRIAPGEGSEEVGYLTEGEQVKLALVNGTVESKMAFDDGQWVHLLLPLNGWANENYLCEPSSPSSQIDKP